MRLDRRSVRSQLERMGQAHVPPPSADFVVRTEERLRLSRLVTVVDDEPVAARRPRPWVTALVAAAAAALLLAVPNDENRQVSLATDRAATSTTASTAVPTTRLAPTTTTSVPPARPALPPVTATTTTTAAPVAKVRPTTPTTAVAPTPTTTVADRPTSTTTTTTTAPALVRIELRCVPGSDGDLPSITCTWTAPADSPIAEWKLHRAVGTDAKRLVWTTNDVSARGYVDRDVVTGTTYRYAVEGVTAAGRTVAKGGIVDVACCL